MRGLSAHVLVAVFLAAAAPPASADGTTVEELRMQREAGWRFFTDGVMGGVSTGRVVFAEEDGRPHARMTGRLVAPEFTFDRLGRADQHQCYIVLAAQKGNRGRYRDCRTVVPAHAVDGNFYYHF